MNVNDDGLALDLIVRSKLTGNPYRVSGLSPARVELVPHPDREGAVHPVSVGRTVFGLMYKVEAEAKGAREP